MSEARAFAEECLRLADRARTLADRSILIRMARAWIEAGDEVAAGSVAADIASANAQSALRRNPAAAPRRGKERATARQRHNLAGRIIFNNGRSSFDCIVRDISQEGARLAVAHPPSVPEEFELALAGQAKRTHAEIRWRRADTIGISFAKVGASPER
jgi:hypothetical protein